MSSSQISFPANIDQPVYLVTPGAAGTHALVKHFGLRIKGGVPWWNVHARAPGLPPAGSRILYVYGNPYDAVVSYFNRGFMSNPTHCVNMQGDSDSWMKAHNSTLDGYLDYGLDVFALEDHLTRWASYKRRNYNIAFLKYEHVMDHVADIERWTGMSMDGFEFIPRRSDWRTLPPRTSEKLHVVYGKAMHAYESMPTFIVNPMVKCA